MNKKKIIAWGVVLIWMGVIFYLSHQPAASSSHLSKGVMNTVLKSVEIVLPVSDIDTTEYLHSFIRKSAHFFAYFLLGIFTIHATGVRHKSRASFLALFICMLYAASDEIHQLFIPGRSGEIRDVLIDGAGSFTGIIVYLMIHRLLKKGR